MSTREPKGETILAARITHADHGVTPNLRDAALLADRVIAWDSRQRGPRVGDVIRFTDGTAGRFTHDWGKDIQTTPRDRQLGHGSFHLHRNGHLDYSGGLDPAIDKALLLDTGETELASAWFFHDDWPRAHSAVYVQIPCRVYAEKAAP